jgi:hypothetical protein
MNDEDFLGKAMGECLTACIRQDFAFPMHLVMVAQNGALVAVRYAKDEEDEIQAEAIAGHSDKDGFVGAVHVMVVDAQGRSVKMKVGDDGSPEPMLN